MLSVPSPNYAFLTSISSVNISHKCVREQMMIRRFNTTPKQALHHSLLKFDLIFDKCQETGCHFIPHVTDCGFAVIMEDDERFETLETIVRRRYCVEESTLMVITYGIPDWMLSLKGYKVHGDPFSTNTRRVLAVLLEKGISYEPITVDLKTGEHKRESYLSLNPFGQVPVFEDGNIKLCESRAITQYIAYVHSSRGTQLLNLQSHKTMATLTMWMEFEAHQFDPFASVLTWEQVIKPIYGLETDQTVVEENETGLENVLNVYEKRLQESRFLACNTFTLVDLHHLPNIQYLLGTPTKKLFENRPKVRTWVDDITGREAWKLACDHDKS
ncbi:unnamed protein product [Brassica napus]|uniref:glutathione transferase n=1 Tax=Brassica napus TaxID=3708 RepID=A0A816IDB4_BRANA|nr:unnamed protein product [Brassica napus]